MRGDWKRVPMRTIKIRMSDLTIYLKARRLGWVTLWSGEGVVCMKKGG
jgi:hypothetical protein